MNGQSGNQTNKYTGLSQDKTSHLPKWVSVSFWFHFPPPPPRKKEQKRRYPPTKKDNQTNNMERMWKTWTQLRTAVWRWHPPGFLLRARRFRARMFPSQRYFVPRRAKRVARWLRPICVLFPESVAKGSSARSSRANLHRVTCAESN